MGINADLLVLSWKAYLVFNGELQTIFKYQIPILNVHPIMNCIIVLDYIM